MPSQVSLHCAYRTQWAALVYLALNGIKPAHLGYTVSAHGCFTPRVINHYALVGGSYNTIIFKINTYVYYFSTVLCNNCT